MLQKVLYTPQEVLELVDDKRVLIIDIRDKEVYEEGHIPNSVNIPEIFYYLSESTPDGLKKMHNEFQSLFSNAGLTDDKLAIVYEDSLNTRYGGSCRGYWLLSYLGHAKAGILDGSYFAWENLGLPVTGKKTETATQEYKVNPRSEIMATKDDVLRALGEGNIKLLDNRDKQEWIGKSSSPYGIDFAPRKGRIPGAKWIEWYNFMDTSIPIPAFKSPQDVRELCASEQIYPEDDIIIYCFKGARASNTFVAMKQAGFKNLKVYFGSWNEWSRVAKLPIEEGLPEKYAVEV